MNIPKDIDVRAASEPAVTEAEQVNDLCIGFNVTNNDSLKAAVKWIAEIKTHATTIEEKRRSFVDPIRESIDRINNFFKPALDRLSDAERTLKNKVSSYTIAAAVERDRLLASIDPNAGVDEKCGILAKADTFAPPKIPGLALRESWQGKVTDPAAVVKWAVESGRLELLNVDPKALVVLARAADRDPEIPGFKASRVRSVAITPSKVQN